MKHLFNGFQFYPFHPYFFPWKNYVIKISKSRQYHTIKSMHRLIKTENIPFNSQSKYNCNSNHNLSSSSFRFAHIHSTNLTTDSSIRPVKSTTISNNTSNSPLIDSFGRFHDYLRVSLTEKCNLRCVYCMPHDGVHLTPQPQLLTLEERKRTISIFHRLGIRKIRFTGGEPTISNHLVPLVEYSHSLGLTSIGITTNGLELGRNRYRIDQLVDKGLTSINISLDSFSEEKFSKISRRDGKNVYNVLSAIYYAVSKPNLHVKINCVLMKGFNDDELVNFVQFVKDLPVDCRFIEVMPFDGNEWSTSKLMSYHEAINLIESSSNNNKDEDNNKDKESTKNNKNDDSRINSMIKLIPYSDSNQFYDPNDTTKWYQAIDLRDGVPHRGRIGFITSMTSHFCKTCNRLRITADGNVKVCLFGEEGLSIRDKIREGLSDEEIANHINSIVKRKKEALGGHITPENIATSSNRPMILIGG